MLYRTVLLGVSAIALAACGQGERQGKSAASATGAAAGVAETAYPERAYFGDTHVHTGWSADAGMDGAVTSPEDAIRFARGEAVNASSGQVAKLARPYDWIAVTDHSDGMGTISEIVAENPAMVANPVIARWSKLLQGSPDDMSRARMEVINAQATGQAPPEIMDPKWMVSAWAGTIDAAEKYNEPGRFTAFIAYEWTSNSTNGDNLHRNVIYRGDGAEARQVLPQTTFQSQDVETLWAWMDAYEKKTGGKLLAIPHNGNLSNGRMFEETRYNREPMTSAYAAARQKWERLFETTQIKGQSETHPMLSPDDAFADWDRWDRANLNGIPKKPQMIRTEYWREALKSGLKLESRLGVNPFKYGANGATDTHNGLSTPDDDNFWGKFKSQEPGAKRLSTLFGERPDNIIESWEQAASGTMGVWATANTRAALWDAMHRRETFSTTGPRMSVRFFGGYDFTDADLPELVKAGYARGVPMGGDLRAAPAGRAPTFLVAASKDAAGANLDRVQVVKGWVDADGRTHEKIFDVAWSGGRKQDGKGRLPAVGNTVDMQAATYANTIGAAELKGLFRDPEFQPGQRAVYYVRVLEIPTPRWVMHDMARYKLPAPKGATLVQQERAVTSPIWYTPG
jgi:hypothetical protein